MFTSHRPATRATATSGTFDDVSDDSLLSPSKLAAQRIYSSRKPLSFHAALQTSSDSINDFSCDSEPQSPIRDTGVRPAVARTEKTMSHQNPHAEKSFLMPLCEKSEKQDKLAKQQQRFSEYERRLIENNAQFASLEAQVNSLRKVIVQLAEQKVEQARSESTNSVVVQKNNAESEPQSAAQTESDCCPTVTEENSTQVNVWSFVLFATIFIVGLLSILNWVVSLIANFLVGHIVSAWKGKDRQNNDSLKQTAVQK